MQFKQLSSPWGLLVAGLTCVDLVASQNHYGITGVKTGLDATTGYRPPRRDINDLVNDVPQWSLYIQALNQVMAVKETTLTSYFQISGIHGRPYIAWDNVNSTTPGGGVIIGYCTHGNILFPTWHRPYLALIEQVIAGNAQTLAKTYNSATYTQAANELRIPYWDWAAIPQTFPAVLTWPSVRINTATGLKNVTNPLYRYKFQANRPASWFPTNEGDSYLAQQPWTLRNPDSNNRSQEDVVGRSLADDGPSLTSQVWSVFAKSTDFNTMATSSNSGSAFEGPHGSIHVFTGGAGHMSYVSYSGFDPVFWLHHTNVDRQIAMWQAIYPNSWMTPEASGGGTWTITPGTVVDQSSPLTPFYTGDGKTPWTSLSSRYTEAFGYSYPDVKDWLPRTPAQLSANVTARVNQLYNPNGILTRRSSSSMRTKRATEKAWTVEVNVPNAAVGAGFSVDVSVGDIAVGKLVVVSAPTQAELDAGANKTTYGEYTLTPGLGDVADGDVVKYLKANLKWSVSKNLDGASVPVGDVEGLNVRVVDEIVTPARDISSFPVFGKKTAHPEITS